MFFVIRTDDTGTQSLVRRIDVKAGADGRFPVEFGFKTKRRALKTAGVNLAQLRVHEFKNEAEARAYLNAANVACRTTCDSKLAALAKV